MNIVGPLPLYNPDPFNATRQTVLCTPLPSVRDAAHTATSTTTSRYRLRWSVLREWDSFAIDATNYFQTGVTAEDATALVANDIAVRSLWWAVQDQQVITEPDIKRCIMTYVQAIHNQAAIGARGAPLPSDRHAEFISIDRGAGNYNLVGVADFAMRSLADGQPTLLGEVKNPWLVSPQQINQVIEGDCPFELNAR
jgi:hypothetical protein